MYLLPALTSLLLAAAGISFSRLAATNQDVWMKFDTLVLPSSGYGSKADDVEVTAGLISISMYSLFLAVSVHCWISISSLSIVKFWSLSINIQTHTQLLTWPSVCLSVHPSTFLFLVLSFSFSQTVYIPICAHTSPLQFNLARLKVCSYSLPFFTLSLSISIKRDYGVLPHYIYLLDCHVSVYLMIYLIAYLVVYLIYFHKFTGGDSHPAASSRCSVCVRQFISSSLHGGL